MALCEQCGFLWDSDGVAAATVIRHAPDVFAPVLRAPHHRMAIRRRPPSGGWSAIEYAGHTRDSVAWYADRISQIVVVSGTQLATFDADAMAEVMRDRERDAEEVLAGLAETCTTLADLLDGLDPPEWRRTGIGGDGTERDILSLARRAAHEVRHHLADAERVLAELDAAGDA